MDGMEVKMERTGGGGVGVVRKEGRSVKMQEGVARGKRNECLVERRKDEERVVHDTKRTTKTKTQRGESKSGGRLYS